MLLVHKARKGGHPMPLQKSVCNTTDYIYSLPDGQRAELIDGVIYDMAPPGTIHQRLIARLSRVIGNHIDAKHGTCEIFPAPFAVFLQSDNKTYVEPDISVICNKEKLDDKGYHGAPDFIIEVVSPSSRRMDYALKHVAYSNAGVREYWIVDPEKERTTIYRYEDDVAPVIYPFDHAVTVGIYKDLIITIADLLK
jgi:Uma2 family endonuclease